MESNYVTMTRGCVPSQSFSPRQNCKMPDVGDERNASLCARMCSSERYRRTPASPHVARVTSPRQPDGHPSSLGTSMTKTMSMAVIVRPLKTCQPLKLRQQLQQQQQQHRRRTLTFAVENHGNSRERTQWVADKRVGAEKRPQRKEAFERPGMQMTEIAGS